MKISEACGPTNIPTKLLKKFNGKLQPQYNEYIIYKETLPNFIKLAKIIYLYRR